MKTLRIADLFCGAGGTSTGALEAAINLGFEPQLTAINHWDTAIATHTANHPNATHLLTAIDNVNPRELYKAGELDLLWASPECTHHSTARGGRPINEQSRATAWCVVRWADAVQPSIILVENVPEFISWGGIGSNGRPLKQKRGQTFQAWIRSLQSLGYRVDWRVLCAADYGDPTTRKRLFVQAVRGRRKIVWPEPTHARIPDKDMFTLQKPWVAARQIIDWSLEGQSIYKRKRPLSEKTMRRIMTGLKKFGLRPFIVPQTGDNARSIDQPAPTVTTTSRGVRLVSPYLVNMKGKSNASDIDKPLPTQTAHAAHLHLAEPFLLKLRGTADSQLDSSAQSLEKPLPTVATAPKFGVCEPFLIAANGERKGQMPRARSIDEPIPTVCAKGRVNLIEPFIVGIDHQGGEHLRPIGEPLSTISTKARHAIAEPFLVQVAHGNGNDVKGDNRRVRSINEPMATVCGNRGDIAICEPSLLPQQSGGALRSVESPAPTVSTDGAIGLVEPFLIEYYGTGNAESVNEPLSTVTTKHRHGLAQPVLVIEGKHYLLDIRFRMLQPHELAGAQGFPRDYKFTGNKTEQVKQIGNAVPCNLVREIVTAVLSQ